MDAGAGDDGAQALHGAAMREVGAVQDAAVAFDGEGRVCAVGPRAGVRECIGPATEVVDAAGGFVCPAFVDAHTHLVHAGSREAECVMRLAGADYLDVLRAGGGIMQTVRETRAAPFAALLGQARESARRMLAHGVTTLEAKTGYGLELEAELRQLRVAAAVAEGLPQKIVHTAMPAHAIPPERRNDRDRFVREIVDMLGPMRDAGAEFADVFVEEGVFSVDEGRFILSRAKELGLGVKVHADELAPSGGAKLAAELGAASADHLLFATDDSLRGLAQAGTVAVCLPGTSFYLQKPAARARFMMDEAGLAVAVASDYNPGSAPSENFALVMSLAFFHLRMTPEEVFCAATRNAACAIGRGGRAGVLKVGLPGDLVVFAARHPTYILSHYGESQVQAVFAGGRRVYGEVATSRSRGSRA